MRLQRQLRYKALSDIIVGGRLLFAKGSEFSLGEQFGNALVREGRLELLDPGAYARSDVRAEQDARQPLPKGRHKRRDMRAKDKE